MSSSASSYLCLACGGVVLEARRQAHEEHWCPCRAGGDSDSDRDDSAPISVELLATVSPQYATQVAPSLSFAPGVVLHFKQSYEDAIDESSKDADHATGGQLWWSEIVLAEYLAIDCPAATGEQARSPTQSCVVSLGAGSAPVSAYVAAMLGFDTLCTDLPEVLPLALRNAAANIDACECARHALTGRSVAGVLDFLPLCFGEALPVETSRWLESHGDVRIILCSDCIWDSCRHEALAATIAHLLETPGSQALIAYQVRQRDESLFFRVVERFNLEFERLDIKKTVRRVCFPKQFSGGVDACDNFHLYSIWKRAA